MRELSFMLLGVALTLLAQHLWRTAEARSRMPDLKRELRSEADVLQRAVFASRHIRREGQVIVRGVLGRHR